MKLSRYKRSASVSYALGATIVYELYKTHPELIARVFLRPDIDHGQDLQHLLSLLKDQRIEIIESSKAFNILGAKDNCLLIAEFQKPGTHLESTSDTPHVVLVNPSDAGNLGTIMRTAVAFGYENLALIEPCVDPYDPKAIRASMGAVFHLRVEVLQSFQNYLDHNTSPSENRQFYAFMLNKNATSLPELTLPNTPNYGLIFGNEAAGLPRDFCERHEEDANIKPVFIPQSANVDSLNLSTAASIALYEFSIKKPDPQTPSILL